MSIGPRELARAIGVSTDTLRHYERLGLLTGVARTAGGYRRYSQSAVARVQLIQAALTVGFSLKELKQVLAVRARGGAPCRNVRATVGVRLEAINLQIDELVLLRDELDALLQKWDERLTQAPDGEQVHLLEALALRPGLEQARRARHRKNPTPNT